MFNNNRVKIFFKNLKNNYKIYIFLIFILLLVFIGMYLYQELIFDFFNIYNSKSCTTLDTFQLNTTIVDNTIVDNKVENNNNLTPKKNKFTKKKIQKDDIPSRIEYELMIFRNNRLT